MQDRLLEIFERREAFMKSLQASSPGEIDAWPLDLSKKQSQQHVRDMALRGVEEMFEALQHLKNWKPHRKTEVKEFDREEFLEEIVDAFNYFLSILILTGFDDKDLMNAYRKKDEIINERLRTGY
jgi:predicted house-cleaning noncanonical NTP pyrophosphatase (MazG superfamily)